MRLRELPAEGLVLWGIGREGRSVLEQLHSLPGRRAAPAVLTDTPLAEDERAGLEERWGPLRFAAGADTVETLASASAVIKSPGISVYRPELVQAQRRNPGLQLSSATRLWFAEPGAAARTVAVTGSKGKSTTAALICHALQAAGRDAKLGGNIGMPATQWLTEEGALPAGDWTAVLELSSYQLADLDARPRVGILTNLFAGHARWHGGVQNYYRDKLRLFQAQTGAQHMVLNRQDAGTLRLLGDRGDAHWYPDEKSFHPRGAALWKGKECWGLPGSEALRGQHSLLNICAALEVLKLLGADARSAFESFAAFRGLPHRQEILGEREGLHYVDDSIATIPEAALAAVERFREDAAAGFTLLAGGEEIGQHWERLARALRGMAHCTVIAMPENGQSLLDELQKWRGKEAKQARAENLAEAMALAKKLTPPGGIVLLSPGAPSYGQFRNFEERGKCFQELAGFAGPAQH